MGLLPQSADAPGAGGVRSIGGVQVGVLGETISPRGIRFMAVDGPVSDRTKVFMMPDMATFSCSLRTPNNIALTVDGLPFRTTGPLGFIAAGVPLQMRATGHFTYAVCYLGLEFLSALAETESGLTLAGIDLLYSIKSERLTHLSRAAFRESIEPGFCSSLLIEAIATSIALELARYSGARRLSETPPRHGLAHWQLRRLDDYIRAHVSKQLTLHELAMLLGISVRHLSRAVRQTKGISVHRWITDYRLSEARRLLGETEMPINEIARRTAFQSTAAFSTAFRAVVGLTPSKFRHMSLLGAARR